MDGGKGYNNGTNPDWVKYDVCIELPPKVNSEGDIYHRSCSKQDKFMLSSSMPELEASMCIMFFTSHFVHFLLKRIGVPRISSEIISGIILTLILVNYSTGKQRMDFIFTPTGQEILGTVTMFGYQMYLFVTGVKMDMGAIIRTERKAMVIGLTVPLLSFFLGLGIKPSVAKGLKDPEVDRRLTSVIIGQSLTSFPVIHDVVTYLKIQNTEFGRLTLSASMVSEMVSLSFVAVDNIRSDYRRSGLKITLLHTALFAAFILILVFVIRPLFIRIVKNTPEGRPVKNVYIYCIVALAFFATAVNYMFGQFIFFGLYLTGFAVPEGPPLGSAITEKLECFVSGVYLPLMVASTGMRVNVKAVKFDSATKATVLIIIVCYIANFVSCFIPCLAFRMPSTDSIALSLLMTSQGIVHLVFYSMSRDDNGVDDHTYTIAMFTILFLSIAVPIATKYIHDPSKKYVSYQKRNIMNLKPNAELRVLTCINRPDNIPAMVNLLEYACPTKENPVTVYVLHLIELIGRSNPIFISHQIQKKTVSNVSYSENVILSFRRFERDNWGAVTVNAFTAISPPKLMYDDICTMALGRLTSLIILPFHRKWSQDGSVEVDDNMVRMLNSGVLERAPCSVGIYVDRGAKSRRRGNNSGDSLPKDGHAYLHSVCVMFMGGKDDREALVFAKRMAKEQSISLTVIHFTTAKDAKEDPTLKWDKMLDAEVLKDIRYSNMSVGPEDGIVGYAEEIVKDGSETALIVRSLVDDYDLIIAGRHYGVEKPQTAGLMEWSEFPELGVIGDLLVSADIYGKASVLVIQQQVIE